MKPTHLVIHCSDSTWGDAEEIRRWHTQPKPHGNGWSDIGYHFVITNAHPRSSVARDEAADGRVALGRPEYAEGSHALGMNGHSLGVCLVGRMRFTPKQMMALEALCRELMARHGIPAEHVIGHRETPHEQSRAPHVRKTCPNFDVAALRGRLQGA